MKINEDGVRACLVASHSRYDASVHRQRLRMSDWCYGRDQWHRRQGPADIRGHIQHLNSLDYAKIVEELKQARKESVRSMFNVFLLHLGGGGGKYYCAKVALYQLLITYYNDCPDFGTFAGFVEVRARSRAGRIG